MCVTVYTNSTSVSCTLYRVSNSNLYFTQLSYELSAYRDCHKFYLNEYLYYKFFKSMKMIVKVINRI